MEITHQYLYLFFLLNKLESLVTKALKQQQLQLELQEDLIKYRYLL